MEQINAVVADLQSVETSSLESSVAGINAAIAKLQAITLPAATPIPDAPLEVTMQSGAVFTCSPKV